MRKLPLTPAALLWPRLVDFPQWPSHDHRAVGRLAVELAVSNKWGERVVAWPAVLQAAAEAVERGDAIAAGATALVG